MAYFVFRNKSQLSTSTNRLQLAVQSKIPPNRVRVKQYPDLLAGLLGYDTSHALSKAIAAAQKIGFAGFDTRFDHELSAEELSKRRALQAERLLRLLQDKKIHISPDDAACIIKTAEISASKAKLFAHYRTPEAIELALKEDIPDQAKSHLEISLPANQYAVEIPSDLLDFFRRALIAEQESSPGLSAIAAPLIPKEVQDPLPSSFLRCFAAKMRDLDLGGCSHTVLQQMLELSVEAGYRHEQFQLAWLLSKSWGGDWRRLARALTLAENAIDEVADGLITFENSAHKALEFESAAKVLTLVNGVHSQLDRANQRESAAQALGIKEETLIALNRKGFEARIIALVLKNPQNRDFQMFQGYVDDDFLRSALIGTAEFWDKVYARVSWLRLHERCTACSSAADVVFCKGERYCRCSSSSNSNQSEKGGESTIVL